MIKSPLEAQINKKELVKVVIEELCRQQQSDTDDLNYCDDLSASPIDFVVDGRVNIIKIIDKIQENIKVTIKEAT